MAFKAKPYVTVGKKDWRVTSPRPPKHATHARMVCVDPLSGDPTPKTATLPIQDFACFRGVVGDFSYVRMDKRRKIHEKYKGTWHWDGFKVPKVQEMMDD